MAKAKGKTPSLIGFSNGRPKRIEVKRVRTCVRCDRKMGPGEDCFDVPRQSGGFPAEKPYCKGCYINVLDQTQQDLNQLRTL